MQHIIAAKLHGGTAILNIHFVQYQTLTNYYSVNRLADCLNYINCIHIKTIICLQYFENKYMEVGNSVV